MALIIACTQITRMLIEAAASFYAIGNLHALSAIKTDKSTFLSLQILHSSSYLEYRIKVSLYDLVRNHQ